MNHSNLPEQIRVKVGRAHIGMWVAESPDLLGFSVTANNESSLRTMIAEQIAWVCRARGLEVATAPIGKVDDQTSLWSVTVRNPSRPSGPDKVGGIDRIHWAPK